MLLTLQKPSVYSSWNTFSSKWGCLLNLTHIHCYLTTPRTFQFFSNQAAYWTIAESGFDFDQEQEMSSLLHSVQTDCGVHPAPYTMGTGGTYPRLLKRRRLETGRSPKSSADIKNAWSLLTTWFHARFLLRLFFDPENGGDMFIRNVGWLSMDCTALNPTWYCNVFGYWDTQFGWLIGFVNT
jgi:hypothetical protein